MQKESLNIMEFEPMTSAIPLFLQLLKLRQTAMIIHLFNLESADISPELTGCSGLKMTAIQH